MIFLLPAILTSTGILILFKLFEKRSISNLQAIAVNYVTAAVLGFIFFDHPDFSDVIAKNWFPFSLISGITLFLVFIVYAVSTQKAGLSITSVSGKMSLIIPVICGVFLLDNTMPLLRMAGIILALLSFYLTLKKESGIKLQLSLLIFPLLLLIGNGINDTILNYAQVKYAGEETGAFLSFAFLAAFVPCIVAVIVRLYLKKEVFKLVNVGAGLLLGMLNYFSTYFFMAGLNHVETGIFIPLFNAGVVLSGVTCGILFFREKMRSINIAGVFLCLCAILIIAIS
ncbi:MAG: hypothetical protein V2A54_06410 [Bacteroidota bacterium]